MTLWSPCATCSITPARRWRSSAAGNGAISTRIGCSSCEIIGEAAGRVPPEVQDHHPSLPWREAIGARNRLIYGYDFVDLDILWEIVSTDLPQLVLQVEKVIETEGRG